jgi:hypothetical protein
MDPPHAQKISLQSDCPTVSAACFLQAVDHPTPKRRSDAMPECQKAPRLGLTSSLIRLTQINCVNASPVVTLKAQFARRSFSIPRTKNDEKSEGVGMRDAS